MGLAKLTITMMMCALFGIAIITWVANVGIDNGTNIRLGQDEDFDDISSDLNDDIEQFYSDANVSSDAFQKSTISSQTEASEGGTQFKVTPGTSLSMFKKTLSSGFEKIFGSDSEFGILFTALIGVLAFLIFLYAMSAWRGNP